MGTETIARNRKGPMRFVCKCGSNRVHMVDPIFSPDGSQTWTGTKWVPIQSETQHSSEFSNPFQSQHSVVEVGNHASTQIEYTYPDRKNVEYIDVFKQQQHVEKWKYYGKMLLVLLWLGAVCLSAYFGEFGLLVAILLMTLVGIFVSSILQYIPREFSSNESTLHSKIILALLIVGGIGFFSYATFIWDEGNWFVGILLTGAYFVPAALLYQAVLFYDKQIETLGWKRGMISASLKMVKWVLPVVFSIALALATESI
jgi:hypothetical protein